jgi:hypothetical protein
MEQLNPYVVGHHRSGVANDIFNGVGTPGLVVCLTALGQQCGTVLLRRWSLQRRMGVVHSAGAMLQSHCSYMSDKVACPELLNHYVL